MRRPTDGTPRRNKHSSDNRTSCNSLRFWSGPPPNSGDPVAAWATGRLAALYGCEGRDRTWRNYQRRWITFLVRPQYDRRGLRYQRLAEFILLLARDGEADAKPVDRCQRHHSLGGIG